MWTCCIQRPELATYRKRDMQKGGCLLYACYMAMLTATYSSPASNQIRLGKSWTRTHTKPSSKNVNVSHSLALHSVCLPSQTQRNSKPAKQNQTKAFVFASFFSSFFISKSRSKRRRAAHQKKKARQRMHDRDSELVLEEVSPASATQHLSGFCCQRQNEGFNCNHVYVKKKRDVFGCCTAIDVDACPCRSIDLRISTVSQGYPSASPACLLNHRQVSLLEHTHACICTIDLLQFLFPFLN